jgi:hypothetical protein
MTGLREDRVVAPKLMNEHNPDTLEPLGFLTEHHGDTRAIRFVDGRVGKGLPTLLSDVANWPDMMVITDVGGQSVPTKREVDAARAPNASDPTRLKSKHGLNATGIEQHFMVDSLIQYKTKLMRAENPLHNLLPGFPKDGRFLSANHHGTNFGTWCMRTQGCWEWSAGQMKSRRDGKRGRGALSHFDTIGVRWEEHIEIYEG